MARVIKKSVVEDEKITAIKQAAATVSDITSKFNCLQEKDRISALKSIGVGSEYFTCSCCGEPLNKKKFYVSTAPGYATGITAICKECAEDLACPNEDGKRQSPTKESVDRALYALNKPFLDTVWDSSLLEAANSTLGKTKSNVWNSYIKNIQMPNYYTLTYKQSDGYTGGIFSLDSMANDALPKDRAIIEQFEKNKNDTLRLLGYLPFEKEKLADQPFLYSQLIGFLDSSEEGNDDMMRVSSIISIVRGFLQQSQIDDMIASLSQDIANVNKNVATIKSLQDMKRNITIGITKLAESSCISLKHSKNAVKGENTWTGKIKKIKDMNLRDFETNGFDMATCRGMQQVQEISDASIMKQLHLDESDWSDMVAQLRQIRVDLQRERDAYKEINRILLRENIDLKDFISENGISIDADLANLKDLYSIFSDVNNESNNEVIENYSEVNSDE